MIETPEQIDPPPQGSDIDARIAEKIMGWYWTKLQWSFQFKPAMFLVPAESSGNVRYELPKYSSDMSEAWKVVERLPFRFWFVKCDSGIEDGYSPKGTKYKVCIDVDYGKSYEAFSSESMPHAICLAALKFVEGT